MAMNSEAETRGTPNDRELMSELVRTVARTDANVSALTHTVEIQNNRVSNLENRQADAQKINYAPISIAASFIVAIAITAGSLVAYSIASEANARKDADSAAALLTTTTMDSSRQSRLAADKAQREYFDLAIKLRAEIIEANKEATEARIAGEIKRIDQNRTEDRAARELLRERVTLLYERLDDKIDNRFAMFDETLQREMRLLDEVLQREVGLNISRIDEILDRMDERLDSIEDSRFDANRGDRMQDEIDINRRKLDEREPLIYGEKATP